MRVLSTLLIAGLLAAAAPEPAWPHGSVAADDDVCLIEIGYYKAHFKVYQPAERGHEAFCEDLPGRGEAVFVMEYVHPGLGAVPIDFRIIRNVTGQGRFTRLADVRSIADLDPVTVYHQPAQAQPDVFTVRHEFRETGSFVGMVTLKEPGTSRVHTAVFPFDVGFPGFGYWPWFALAALLLQLNYLWMSGWSVNRLRAAWRGRRRRKRRPRLSIVPGARHG